MKQLLLTHKSLKKKVVGIVNYNRGKMLIYQVIDQQLLKPLK